MPKKGKKRKARSMHAKRAKRARSVSVSLSSRPLVPAPRVQVQKPRKNASGKSSGMFSLPFFSHAQNTSQKKDSKDSPPRKMPVASLKKPAKAAVQKAAKPVVKDRRKYRIIYSFFLIVSLGLTILSFIRGDLFSFSVGIAMMVLSILCYRVVVESKQQKNLMVYVMVWPFTLALAVAAIFKKEIISFIIAILAMFISLLTPMLALKQAKKREIIAALSAIRHGKDTETDLDKLLAILQKYGKLRISDVRNAFDIEKGKAEEWAKILEENNLAYLHYPTFGEEELRVKEKKT